MRHVMAFLLAGVSVSLAGVPTSAQRRAPMTMDDAMSVLRTTLQARVAPLRFAIPDGNVKWEMRVMRLNDDTFFLALHPAGGDEFELQLTLCTLDAKAFWSDATLLGPRESAEVFYRDNVSYLIFQSDMDYIRCGEQGVVLHSKRLDDGRSLYMSDDRLLKQLSNWVTLFDSRKNQARALEFTRMAVMKQREELMAGDRERDYERVAGRIALFDRFFPFAVLDRLTFTMESDRQLLVDWLNATIAQRQRLKVLAPALATNLARDESLLKKLKGAGAAAR